MSTPAANPVDQPTPVRLDQIRLVTAIVDEMARQGIKQAHPRFVNAAIDAANSIVRECSRPIVLASAGMGLTAWLASDDTGMSSRFMAHYIASWSSGWPAGVERPEYAHPHDPADFARCLRLLDAVPEFRAHVHKMAGAGGQWPGLVKEWSRLEELYREEAPSGNCPKLYAAMKKLKL